MSFRKGPAVLTVVAAAVVVVVVLLLSGDDEESKTSSASSASPSAQSASGGSSSKGSRSGSEGDEQGKNPSKTAGGAVRSAGGADEDAEQEVPVIDVKGGEPIGGVQGLEYSTGDQIRFVIASDTADEIHLHGYDVYQDVPAGGETELSLPADIEGVFEAELHDSGAVVAEVTVTP